MIERYQLPNGLTVVLEENHAAPVVAFQAWVKVGSADEPEELAGIAHVFEHMLFKGTARRGVGQIAQEVESSGGDINAWTSFDQTVYHLVLASRFFDAGLDILSDALQNSSFDEGELARELKVVIEEVKQGEDQPSRIASQALFASAYAKHPYRRPVIGWSRTVEKFRRPALIDFFKRHYVPRNVTLVVAGDFDLPRAKMKIDEAWGPVAPSTPPAIERAVEPAQRAPRAVVTGADVREAHLAVAFHIPGIRHPDTGALDVGAILLGQGDSSRLQIEVKRNRQLVTDVYAYSYTPKDPGLLVAGATLPPDKLDEALDAILDEVFRLGRLDASAEELAKAKAIIESDAVYQKETVQGMARKLGFYETVAGALGFEEEYNRQVRDVTPRRLRETIARYLRPENATISLLAPKEKLDEKKLRARLLERLDAAWKRAELADQQRPLAAAPGQVIREVLPNGARLLILRDPSIPIAAMRAVWSGGLRVEDEKTNGVNNLLAALLTRGTRTRSGDELAHEIESMAGSIGGFSGRNSFGIRAEVLSRHADRALALLADCVLHPAFSDEEIEKERRLVLEELRTQEDNVSAVAFRVFSQALYPKHAYRLDALGTPESIAGLSRRKIVDYYRRMAPPSGMTLAVVGDVDPAKISAEVHALFDVPSASSPPSSSSRSPSPFDAAGPKQVFKFLNKQQAHLVYGFPGTTVGDPDRFPLEVLSTILSGQGGRLFVELRDKRGLAYRVSAFSLEGVDPGYFAVYMATSPENLAVAEQGIKDELAKVIDHPVPKAELERAKRYLVGAHDISLQRRSALASTLAFHECYGLGWDEYKRYAPGILAVTAADVQRVAKKYLDPQKSVLAVVKPEEVAPAIEKKRAAREAADATRAREAAARAQNHRKRKH